jgi:hypothetical protein
MGQIRRYSAVSLAITEHGHTAEKACLIKHFASWACSDEHIPLIASRLDNATGKSVRMAAKPVGDTRLCR